MADVFIDYIAINNVANINIKLLKYCTHILNIYHLELILTTLSCKVQISIVGSFLLSR